MAPILEQYVNKLGQDENGEVKFKIVISPVNEIKVGGVRFISN